MNGLQVHAELHKIRTHFFSLFLFLLVGCVPEVKTVLPPGTSDFGTLDITQAFKGSGLYSGYDATVLPAGKVCTDKTVFGVAGTAVCQGTSGGTNSTAAEVAAGTYFWDATGKSIQGTMTNKGTWDLTGAFPGSGYYSGISSSLAAGDVCNTKNVLGAPGTAVCQSGVAAAPAGVANVLAGKEYWDSTGTKNTGTMVDRGGVWDLTTAFPGSGYYSAISSALAAGDVCNTKNILGAVGLATCLSGSTVVPAGVANVLAGKEYWDSTGTKRAGTMVDRGGAWDLTTAFPGAGYYSAIAAALAAGDVCNTKNLLGAVGTATCLSGSTVSPAVVANVLAGKEYWDSTGTKNTGTMTDRGGAWDLTTAFPGTGYYSGITSALAAADVCTTKNILGSSGTAVCNSVIGDLFSSQAVRKDNATIDLTSAVAVAARARGVLSDEVAGNATFTANHSLVPNPKYDTDGQGDDSGIGTTLRNYLVTVKGRPTKVCGLAGSTATRVSDCATQNPTKGIWEGKKYGQLGEGDWKLVTLYKAAAIVGDTCNTGAAGGCYEVWRDERTGLIWSDSLNNATNNYNWFQAAGYSSSATTVAVTGKEGRAGVGADCLDISSNPVVCQPAIPISVCADSAPLANANGVAAYQNPDGTNGTHDEGPAKGNITGAAALWRLPTYADWALAYVNGIAKVLPSMSGSDVYWTATSYSSSRGQAWIAGTSGLLFPGSRDQVYAVRCVGH